MKNSENAQILALQALAYIAGDAETLEKFLLTTGVQAERLRGLAADSVFQAGVLDYLLGDESVLLAFATHQGIKPEAIVIARNQMAGAHDAA